MSQKIEVTDEMVERYIAAASAAYERVFKVTCKALNGNFDVARAGLEAALNPRQDSEIVVTREQTQAGLWAFYGEDDLPNPEPWRSNLRHKEMAKAYRAMRKLEPSTGTHGSAPKAREANPEHRDGIWRCGPGGAPVKVENFRSERPGRRSTDKVKNG